FRVPATITDPVTRQFESQLFRKIAAICGAKVGHRTPYHPQCLRASPRPDVNHTIAQMVYGTCIKLPDRLKSAYLLESDHHNEQTTAEYKNTTPNPVDPHLMPNKKPTTIRGRKINRPVRFRE
ncbi:hypothetical protein NPIL_593921, partial [Nephila pilipes]